MDKYLLEVGATQLIRRIDWPAAFGDFHLLVNTPPRHSLSVPYGHCVMRALATILKRRKTRMHLGGRMSPPVKIKAFSSAPIYLALLLALVFQAAAIAETHDFASSGSAIVSCTCTVGECGIKTSHQPFVWTMNISAPQGRVDIDQVCYRHQADDRSDGVTCCDFGASTSGTYTKGVVSEECPGVTDKTKCY